MPNRTKAQNAGAKVEQNYAVAVQQGVPERPSSIKESRRDVRSFYYILLEQQLHKIGVLSIQDGPALMLHAEMMDWLLSGEWGPTHIREMLNHALSMGLTPTSRTKVHSFKKIPDGQTSPFIPGKPKCPKQLSEPEAALFKQMAKQMEGQGILSETDVLLLTMYAVVAHHVNKSKKPPTTYLKNYRDLLIHVGSNSSLRMDITPLSIVVESKSGWDGIAGRIGA